MITKEIVKTIGFIVNIPCKYFLASAFGWDSIHLECVVTEKGKLRWKFGSFLVTFYFLFLLYGLAIHISNFKRENLLEASYHTIYVIGYFTTMCDKLNYTRCKQFYVPVVNGIFKYYVCFSGKTIHVIADKVHV